MGMKLTLVFAVRRSSSWLPMPALQPVSDPELLRRPRPVLLQRQ